MVNMVKLHEDEFASFSIHEAATDEVVELAQAILSNPRSELLAKLRLHKDMRVLENSVTVAEGPRLDDENVHFAPAKGRELASLVLERTTN